MDGGVVVKMPLVKTSSSELRKEPQTKFLSPSVAQYIVDNGLYIDEQIKPLLSTSRYEHTLRVCKLAMQFANKIDKRLLKKIYIASMYHDVCKEFDDQCIRKYLKTKYQHLHIAHGMAGANYIKKHFNIRDSEVLEAISNHVIPNKEPSMLTKMLYCADKLEPKRTKQDIANRLEMIRLVEKDINKYF
jgi:nicotinate-nucleotide adenylyltransferase